MATSDDPQQSAQPAFEQEQLEERLVVVRVHGELDIGSGGAPGRALDQAAAKAVGAVASLASPALGVPLSCARRMPGRGGRLELLCTSPAIRRVLDMTMISR